MNKFKFIRVISGPGKKIQSVYRVEGSLKRLLRKSLKMPDFTNRKITVVFNNGTENEIKEFTSFSKFCDFSKDVIVHTCTVSGTVFLRVNKNSMPIKNQVSICAQFQENLLTITAPNVVTLWRVKNKTLGIPTFSSEDIDLSQLNFRKSRHRLSV